MVNAPEPARTDRMGFNPISNPQWAGGAIPTPRQNPLSDTTKFTYAPGRDRDYVFAGNPGLDGLGKMDQASVSKLVAMQEKYGAPFKVTSGFRGPNLNYALDGKPASQHLNGKAFDVHTTSRSKADYDRLAAAAGSSGFTGLGGYGYGSLHVDTGPNRSWGPLGGRVTSAAARGMRDRSITSYAGYD